MTRARARLASLGLLFALTAVGCGARTELAEYRPAADAEPAEADAPVDAPTEVSPDAPHDAPDTSDAPDTPDAPPIACTTDADCDAQWACDFLHCVSGTCVSTGKARCDDGDPCTLDRCDPATRTCSFPPATLDADGDGHRAVLTGGPAKCGDDCDDGDPKIHPGARELCNGKDDDCNGLIDDGTTFATIDPEVVIAPPGAIDSLPTGATAWSHGFSTTLSWHPSGSALSHLTHAIFGADLARAASDRDLGGPLGFEGRSGAVAWAGDRFGVAWLHTSSGGDGLASRFALLDDANQYRGPGDVALFDPGWDAFGIDWTGSDFLVHAWVQSADQPSIGATDLHGAHVSAVGVPGLDLALPGAVGVQMPDLAPRPYGGWVVAWQVPETISKVPGGTLTLATLDEPLQTLGPKIAPFGNRAATQTKPVVVGDVAYMAILNVGGVVEFASVDLVTGKVLDVLKPLGKAGVVRDPFLMAAGGRLLLAWADTRADGKTFEIYVQPFDLAMKAIGSPIRITDAPGASRRPWVVPIGGTPDLVVLWDDARGGKLPQAYARKLSCAAP
jgi:hypothetical protein